MADTVKSVFPDLELAEPFLGHCIAVSLLRQSPVEDGVENGNLRLVYVREVQDKLTFMFLFIVFAFANLRASFLHNKFAKWLIQYCKSVLNLNKCENPTKRFADYIEDYSYLISFNN